MALKLFFKNKNETMIEIVINPEQKVKLNVVAACIVKINT